MPIVETLGLIAALSTTTGLLWKVIKASGKTLKKLTKLISKTPDPILKKLLTQKAELEKKEIAIMKTARKLIIIIGKKLKKAKNMDSSDIMATTETAELIKNLGDQIGKLKILKEIKLNLQKKIYSTSKKLRNSKDEIISLSAVAKEIIDLEIQLENEEEKEAQIEEIIAKVILSLQNMKGIKTKKSKTLAQLLNDFIALGRLSIIERHVDEQIHSLIESEITRDQIKQKAA